MVQWIEDKDFDKHYQKVTNALRKLDVQELILLAHCMNTDGDCLVDGVFNPDGKKDLVKNIFQRIRLMRDESVQLERMRKAMQVLNSVGCIGFETSC